MQEQRGGRIAYPVPLKKEKEYEDNEWIIAGLAPAFAAGSSMLAAGVKPGFEFWFGFAGAFIGGLAGMGVNKGLGKTQGE